MLENIVFSTAVVRWPWESTVIAKWRKKSLKKLERQGSLSFWCGTRARPQPRHSATVLTSPRPFGVHSSQFRWRKIASLTWPPTPNTDEAVTTATGPALPSPRRWRIPAGRRHFLVNAIFHQGPAKWWNVDDVTIFSKFDWRPFWKRGTVRMVWNLLYWVVRKNRKLWQVS